MDAIEASRWFRTSRRKTVDEASVMALYFQCHPRTAFLKNLKRASTVLDIGAGDGSLSLFRDWPSPKRRDLKMYAYSIEKGERFDDFDGYRISDWNMSPPVFEGLKFDAIICAHFIEHIQRPESLAQWAAENMTEGGRIYIEWPSPRAANLPPLSEMRAAGIPLVISRYDDDNTHQNAIPDREKVCSDLRQSGLEIEAEGIVRLPWLEDEMLAHFSDSIDTFPLQAAFWSATGWCQYVVAEKTA